MAFDEKLAERVRAILNDRAGVTERRMFGGIAFMVRGHMTVGINDGTLMARVGPDAHQESLARAHVRPMDFTGKPMRGYVYVDAPGIDTQKSLRDWVTRSIAFVDTLPPKKKK